MKEIHEIIRDLREDRDKKQVEIAMYLGITTQQYSLYETGKREFKLKHIKQLCKFYNVSADYILGLSNNL
ncbi:MAG: helix-turn-helix transcriptional regulator [Clostridia bacterium]|nr:helix-turn-helix transcriptional regulator [Clostridia bacterium]